MSTDGNNLYPPAPDGAPDHLVRASWKYRMMAIGVLVTLMAALAIYLALVFASGWALWHVGQWLVTGLFGFWRFVGGLALAAALTMVFAFLVKGLFKRHHVDRDGLLELEPGEEPELFAFIEALCDETSAPRPERIFLSSDVNAAVLCDRSLLNLVVPARKNLLIGLGLVNHLNLTEFKAVLAHEFGHFSQRTLRLGTYVYVARSIIEDMIYSRDRWDEMLYRWQNTGSIFSLMAHALAAIVWGIRKALGLLHHAIVLSDAALSRQMEFQADRFAVRAAGSDAIVCALARVEFAELCLTQAGIDLSHAADASLFTTDLYHHQTRAAPYLRRVHDDPRLGRLDPGEPIFAPGDELDTSMYATHPPPHERERHAREHYVATSFDERSAWELFSEPGRLRRRMTRRLTELQFGDQIPELEAKLASPEEVQAFIDEERAAMDVPARYGGIYDERFLQPGDLDERVTAITDESWTPGRLDEALDGLFDDAFDSRVATFQSLREDMQRLQLAARGYFGRRFTFRGSTRRRREIQSLMEQLDEDFRRQERWFAELDRDIFEVHYRIARRLERAEELLERYRFHLCCQQTMVELRAGQAALQQIFSVFAGAREIAPEALPHIGQELLRLHAVLDESVERARSVPVPQLPHVDAGETLGALLIDGARVVDPAPLHAGVLEPEWLGRFAEQYELAGGRLGRLGRKSVGRLVAMHEELAAQWDAHAQ